MFQVLPLVLHPLQMCLPISFSLMPLSFQRLKILLPVKCLCSGWSAPLAAIPWLSSFGSRPPPSSADFHALPAGVTVLKWQCHTVSSPGSSLECEFGIYISPPQHLHPGCLSGTPNLTPSPYLPPVLFSLCVSLTVTWHQALDLGLGPSSSLFKPAV